MNLIDCSYFYAGPLQVTNALPVDDLDNNAFAVHECITAYIVRYQGEFLDKMVGEELSAAVSHHLDGSSPGQADMCDLCERLRLPFAHYVYFKLVGDVNQNMTITGLMKLKSANDNQPPRQRMVKVWNDMVQLNKKFIEWAETSDYDVYYHVEMITPINQYNL